MHAYTSMHISKQTHQLWLFAAVEEQYLPRLALFGYLYEDNIIKVARASTNI